ncbi:MAG: Lrp/AsnC family transcriptional regulator [Deltaproteobacteria bacterium]|nr:Lrp/AsnC family transcriptional regulator [Deltaproteobacteria bacterium]
MPVSDLDPIDSLIMNALQDCFPLVSKPYALLAEKINLDNNLSLTDAEVLKRVQALKERKFIRRIGAIFNQSQLGYRSTLCAARVPADKIDFFSDLVTSSEQVSHNYLRNNDLNIWFTFCYKDQGQLKDFLESLKKESGIDEIYEMPARKIYKIRAVFNV